MKPKGSQFQQLSMIEPAHKLLDAVSSSFDVQQGESTGNMWGRKLAESKTSEFGDTYGSIQERGYDGPPVRVDHQNDGSLRIHDGHHRLAAAASQGKEVLIEHDSEEARRVRFGIAPGATNKPPTSSDLEGML